MGNPKGRRESQQPLMTESEVPIIPSVQTSSRPVRYTGLELRENSLDAGIIHIQMATEAIRPEMTQREETKP